MARRVFLQQFYPESDDPGHQNSTVDIVLIHGVNGDAIKTWECKNESKDKNKDLGDTIVWPRHLLPQRFPGARVLSFGYNADIYHSDSIAGIRDVAKTFLSCLALKREDVDPNRPIIFIAHCLGGFILKQALHTAHYERDYNGIAEQTVGIFFFGTPHVATSKDKWDHVAKAYSSLDSSKPTGWLRKRSRLVRALQKDSDDLMDMMDKFRHMLEVDDRSGRRKQRWAIGNWYETLKVPGAKSVIVDATAAQLDALDDEIQRPVDADHVGMTRFATADNQTFGELCSQISKLVPEAARALGNSQAAAATTSQITPQERSTPDGRIANNQDAPPVNVQVRTRDSSGRTIRLSAKATDITYTIEEDQNLNRRAGLTSQSSGYVIGEDEGEENKTVRSVRPGRYLEDQNSGKPSARDFISTLKTTKVPVTAGR